MDRVLTEALCRLASILARRGRSLRRARPASARTIVQLERAAGVRLDRAVRDFLHFSNGSGRACWGAVKTDAVQPIEFLPIERAYEDWKRFAPYGPATYAEWDVPQRRRDARILPRHTRHKRWIPLAEFNGGSTTVLYDGDPASTGRVGQIIAYQHDPDAMYFVAESFTAFLRTSNGLLATHAAELLEAEPPGDEIRDAAANGDVAAVKRALAAGLDADLNDGTCSLIEWAATHGQVAVVKLLARAGASLDGALQAAAEENEVGALRTLLALGVHVDDRRRNEETALMRAARFGRLDAATLLVRHGANPRLRNSSGQTAEALASAKPNTGVLDVLRDAARSASGRPDRAPLPRAGRRRLSP